MVLPVNGNYGRGGPQGGRGGNQRCCGVKGIGNRGRGNVQPGMEVDSYDDKVQCYVFLGKNEAKESNAVITCTILVYDYIANVLFNQVLLIRICV